MLEEKNKISAVHYPETKRGTHDLAPTFFNETIIS